MPALVNKTFQLENNLLLRGKDAAGVWPEENDYSSARLGRDSTRCNEEEQVEQETGVGGQGRQAGQAGQARRREAHATALRVAVARELPERVDNLKLHLHMCLSDLSDRITQIRMPQQDTSSAYSGSYCDTHSLPHTPPLPTTFSIHDTEMQSVAVDGGGNACKELEEGQTVRAAAEAYTKEGSKDSKECKEHVWESLDFPHSPATLAGALAEPEEHWQTSEQEASLELATWYKLAGGESAQLLVGEAGGCVGERESVWADVTPTPLGKENEEEDECLLRARKLLAYLKGSV
jgi:hypothetical protein